jgi:NADP-dependent 3-hydroxy acid dehydrogenase YdfG
MEDPSNEVIFLTGASRGIGREIATSLVTAGVRKLCLVARSQKDLEQTAEACSRISPKVEYLLCALDVCDNDAMERAVQKCIETFYKITIAIHNVGLHGVHSAVGTIFIFLSFSFYFSH